MRANTVKSTFNCITIMFIIMAFIITSVFLSGCNNNSSSLGNEDSSTVINEVLDWNYEDADALTNGNLEIAAKLVQSNNLQDVYPVEPVVVYKAPWNYYGKIIEISGTILGVEDYPPGGDISEQFGGGDVSEIMIMTEDGTLADFMMLSSSGNLKFDDMVTLRGYPVGRYYAENGATLSLALVGKVSTDVIQSVGPIYSEEEAKALVNNHFFNCYGYYADGYEVVLENEEVFLIGCYAPNYIDSYYVDKLSGTIVDQ